ncbi:hypothetical protein [Cupriavidus basilensis]|uniref:hypothetical protein n=1 Tax=Cupriavidus basilensis TaxID=68895 RepID=UPI0020A67EB6|nr:hypothetical protein [Cupriavidus basilensis]MCP3024613.1 hypothetical protein [Cupriavidus basilensis]
MIEDCKHSEHNQAGIQFAEGQDAKELLGAILGIQTELQYGALTPENAVERMRRALRVMPQPVTDREGAQAVVLNAPEHIVLVVGDIAENTPFGDLHEVTWCTGRQHDADVAYVRADLPRTIRAQPHAPQRPEQSPFQARVQPWMLACFGAEIAANTQERNYRFLEEALELVQACGATQSEAHQLVDYVYGRPVGERAQEVGGVMVTLAALCLAQGIDMHAAGDTELARIWTKVEQIRAKRAAKPMYSPLPQHVGTVHDERAAVEYYNQNPSAALFDLKRRFAGPHLSAEAMANDSRAMGENWSVRVEQDGRTILTISDQHLSGEEGADESLIVGAAQHLLAFIGYGLPPSDFDPDARVILGADPSSEPAPSCDPADVCAGFRCRYGACYRAPDQAEQPREDKQGSTAAARDVLAERRRQVESEGWSPEHDDRHPGAMAIAAATYAAHAGAMVGLGYPVSVDAYRAVRGHHVSTPWPWDAEWWKPKDPRRDLVRSGALILAEIERVDRAAIADGEAQSRCGHTRDEVLAEPVAEPSGVARAIENGNCAQYDLLMEREQMRICEEADKEADRLRQPLAALAPALSEEAKNKAIRDAADLIEAEAANIARGHAPNGDWRDDHEPKAAHDEMLAKAAALRAFLPAITQAGDAA